MMNNIDHEANGYKVERTETGQRRRYGDSYFGFKVFSDRPEGEVKKYCTEKVRPCSITTEQYLKEERDGVKDFGDHFRTNYKFRKVCEGEYYYLVNSPSTC